MTTHSFDAHAARSYAEGPPRQVPGYESLHRMVSQLLVERTPPDGRVLVLGAGGGLELRALADAHAGWTFDGVDPSANMIELARHTVGTHADRVQLHQGTIEVAPEGPFDAATCLLTLHFVPREQRLPTLTQLRRRLRPGAPFVVAHLSFPQAEPERSRWMARHAIYGAGGHVDPAHIERTRQAMIERLSILSPAEDEASLREAGFSDVSLFYAGLSLRGWVAYAS